MGIPVEDELSRLRAENVALRAELSSLRRSGEAGTQPTLSNDIPSVLHAPWDGTGHGLSKEDVARYSRQIILPSFGAQAQGRLCRGSVLIVGAGGLGSPAALYLAAAGVGRIGIVDKDTVELSNIHRQIIHCEETVGMHKCASAARALHGLNSSVRVELHRDGLTPANAVQLVRGYDVVVDASDNAPTRYLVSDACCATGRPLVSGAAIGLEGQLTVYGGGGDAPCYRCLFPEAPLPQSCARCSDAGVLGVVPGIIGTLQALEAIKLLSGVGQPLTRRLLLLDAGLGRLHPVKLRARSPTCIACGDAPSITAESLSRFDYSGFTGQAPNDAAPQPLRLLRPEDRISTLQLRDRLAAGEASSSPGAEGQLHPLPVVIDVRPAEQFAICHLPGALPMPWARFARHEEQVAELAASGRPIVVMCRRGNDSQRAVARMQELGVTGAVDVVGGIEAWAREVDPQYPLY